MHGFPQLSAQVIQVPFPRMAHSRLAVCHVLLWTHANRQEHMVLVEDMASGERKLAFRRTTRHRVLYSISLFSLVGKKVLTYQTSSMNVGGGACHDHCLLIRGGFIAWSDVHGEWHQELTCDGHVIRIMDFHCTGSMAPPSLLKYIRFIRRSNVAFWTDDGPRKMFFLATRLHEVTSRQRRLKDHTITTDAHLHCTHEVPGSDSDVLSQWNIIPSDAGSDAPSEWFFVTQNEAPVTESHGDAVSQCSSSARAWLDGDDGDIDSYAHASSGLQWLEDGLHFVPDMTIEWLEHGGPSSRLPRLT